MKLEPVDAGAILARSLDIFSQQLKLREIEVSLHVDPDLPLVLADAGRLEQVFINMLINARDAIEEKWSASEKPVGVKRIQLAASLSGEYVAVVIADTGCGIPTGVLEKIFQPFFTTKKVGKGTGLGLSISYGIIKDCGGDIRAYSTPGEGTRFVITLPVAKNDAGGQP
jgi:histidine kinase